MKQSRWRAPLLAGAGAVAATGLAAAPAAQAFRCHDDHVLGTSLDIVAVAADAGAAQAASAAVRAEIARLDAVLSGHRPDSELAALNRSARATVSPALFDVVAACERWRSATDNGFSARLGAVLALWRDAASVGTPPDRAALRRAADLAASAEVGLDPATRSIRRPDGVTFAPDGLAKGWIIDAALQAARREVPGLAGLMIDIGGDARCWGAAPRPDGWRVGIAAPGAADNDAPATILVLGDQAVATSGRGPRDLALAGSSYGHTVSPRSGWPAERIVSATVVADTAADADALATAFTVLPVAQSLALADRLDGVAMLLVTDAMQTIVSRGWAELAQLPAVLPPSAALAGPGTPWPPGFALAVEYEVPKLESDRYRAPYLIMWITDERRQLVRTVLMLGNDSKWVDSNHVYWRRYGRKQPGIVDTIARATRLPGRYSLVWNGTDELGLPVAQGRYLLHVEAAREHGGHTYQAMPIELGAAGVEAAMPGKDELGHLQARYGAAR